MELRERNKARRRRRILDAAQGLVADGGLEGLTMRKVAEVAEVSVPTLYNLYGGKQDLLIAILEEALAVIDSALASVPTGAPLDRACLIITESVAYLTANENVCRPAVLAGIYAHEHKHGRALRASSAALYESNIREAVAQNLLTGDLDIAVLSEEIFDGFRFAAQRWAAGELTPDAFEAKALHVLCTTLLAVARGATRGALIEEARRQEARLRRRGTGKPAT